MHPHHPQASPLEIPYCKKYWSLGETSKIKNRLLVVLRLSVISDRSSSFVALSNSERQKFRAVDTFIYHRALRHPHIGHTILQKVSEPWRNFKHQKSSSGGRAPSFRHIRSIIELRRVEQQQTIETLIYWNINISSSGSPV